MVEAGICGTVRSVLNEIRPKPPVEKRKENNQCSNYWNITDYALRGCIQLVA